MFSGANDPLSPNYQPTGDFETAYDTFAEQQAATS
jgi:hypothetical protein